MRNFIFGFGLGVAAVLISTFFYVRLGFIDPRADIPIGRIESTVAMPSLDAAVGRRTPKFQNAIQPTDSNLISGMQIYQSDCSTCHGDIDHPDSMLSHSLYPRSPQFIHDAPDMPEGENLYILSTGYASAECLHGTRCSTGSNYPRSTSF